MYLVLLWPLSTPQTIPPIASTWELTHPISILCITLMSIQGSTSACRCKSYTRSKWRFLTLQAITLVLSIVFTLEFRTGVYTYGTQSNLIVTLLGYSLWRWLFWPSVPKIKSHCYMCMSFWYMLLTTSLVNVLLKCVWSFKKATTLVENMGLHHTEKKTHLSQMIVVQDHGCVGLWKHVVFMCSLDPCSLQST